MMCKQVVSDMLTIISIHDVNWTIAHTMGGDLIPVYAPTCSFCPVDPSPFQTLLQDHLQGRDLGTRLLAQLLRVSQLLLLWQLQAALVSGAAADVSAYTEARGVLLRVLDVMLDPSVPLDAPSAAVKPQAGHKEDLQVSNGSVCAWPLTSLYCPLPSHNKHYRGTGWGVVVSCPSVCL